MATLESEQRRVTHGDVFLKVESVDDENTVSGHDIRSGEVFTIGLASPRELATHFRSQSDEHKTFEERLKSAEMSVRKRPDVTIGGRVAEGSVVRFENTRTVPTEDGPTTLAKWPTGIARDPEREFALAGSVMVTLTRPTEKQKEPRPVISIVQEDKAMRGDDPAILDAFDATMDGWPVQRSGIAVLVRDEGNNLVSSRLMSDYRAPGQDGTVRAHDALSTLKRERPIHETEALAAAVVAAVAKVPLDELRFDSRMSPSAMNNAREVYDTVSTKGTGLEIVVAPAASVQLIPKDAEPSFMKDYHGTPNGRFDENVAPDSHKSYRDKGFADTVLAMSANPTDPERAASARLVVPQNTYQFARQPKRNLDAVMDAAMVAVHGESFGAKGPEATAAANPEPARQRRLVQDAAPAMA